MNESKEFVIRNGVLLRYDGKAPHVTVPDGVLTVGSQAFADNQTLESVTLPDGVEELGYGAFKDCARLREITVPDSLRAVGPCAFENTPWFEAQSPLVIVNRLLYRYRGNEARVTIPDGVEIIGRAAFFGQMQLEAVSIPRGVWLIGSEAFYGCSALTSVTLPESVIRLDVGAFEGCRALRTVHLPDSLEEIGTNAFRGCGSLCAVTLGPEVQKIGSSAFADCERLADVRISDSLEEIGFEAFRDTAWIKAQPPLVTLNGILHKYQGEEAEVVIPDGITALSDTAFRDCTSLVSVTVPDSVKQLGKWTFDGCEHLTSVTLGNGLRAIGDCAFSRCRQLTSVTVPEGVEEIRLYAFAECTSLTAVSLPQSLRSLGDGAFGNCRSLKSLALPDGLESVNGSPFNGCTGLLEIAGTEEMFGLVWVKLPTDIKVRWCVNRLKAGLPLRERKRAYVVRMFGEFVALAIRENDAEALTAAVVLKKSVPLEKLDGWIEESRDAPAVRAVLMEYKAKTYSRQAVEKYETEKAEKELGLRPRTAADWKRILKLYTASGEVTVSGLRTDDAVVEIPSVIGRSVVTAIGDWGFYDCSPLQTLILPDSLKRIGDRSFSFCASLAEVVISDGTEEIGTHAFVNCRSLRTVTVPASVTVIGKHAFESCPCLTIRGKAGSAAEKYAKRKRIPFVAE